MKKNFVALFLCAFFVLPLFARGGILAGNSGKLSVLETEYFDIIYPPESAEAAAKIAAVCDLYYEELCHTFMVEPYFSHFPVTITPQVESLNAFFTLYPYNHICLYDTPPENSLDMQSFENIFYHELTHAVSGNLRNKRAQRLSNLIGDFLAPSFWSMTQFWIEGTAVEAESRSEEGRLYDPYSTQLVLQAKVSGTFPSFRDVTGARDIYPGGTDAYLFGGLFSRYLCETYGREQFAAMWKRLGYGKKKVPNDKLIKSLTGKRLKETWKAFEDWLSVPECTPALSEADGSADFFVSADLSPAVKSGFSKLNSRKQLFSCMDTCATGIVYAERKTGGVWYAPYDGEKYKKPRKLFTAQSVSRLAFSDDGRYIAVSYLYDKRTVKTAVCVYDLEKGDLLTLPLPSLRDAGFVRDSDGSLLLCAVNIAHAPYSVDFYRTGKRARDFTLSKCIVFEAGEVPFDPCAAEDGGFACIVHRGLDWRIRLYAPLSADLPAADAGSSWQYAEYGADKTIVHNLHSARDASGLRVLSFSYAGMGKSGSMFPRAGLLYADGEKSEIVLQDDDISGAVFDAALLPSALSHGGESIVHIGEFYDTWRLLCMDFSKRRTVRKEGRTPALQTAASGRGSAESAAGTSGVANQPDAAQPDNDGSAPASYHPLRYAKNGIFWVPGVFDSISSYDSTFSATSDGIGFLGLTFVTANPWGDRSFIASAGSTIDGVYGGKVSLSGGDDTTSYAFSATSLFYDSEFTQSSSTASLSHVLYARYGRTVSFGVTGEGVYGKGISYDEDSDLVIESENDWAATGTLYTLFSTVHKRAPGYFQYGGISFKPFLFASHTDTRCVNAGASVGARIPGLFPLTMSASLFPSADYCASASVSAVLACLEIQKAVRPMYYDRLYLSAGYGATLSYEHGEWWDIQHTRDIFRDVTQDDYSDTVQIKVGLISSINWIALSYLRFDVSGSFLYHPNPEPHKSRAGFKLGFSMDL